MKSFNLSLAALVTLVAISSVAFGGIPIENRDSLLPILPTRIKIYQEDQWNSTTANYKYIDTTLAELHRVDPVKAANNQNLGNLGSPYRNLNYSPNRSIFQSLGLTIFDPYLLDANDVEYWRTNKRFTELNYHMGAFREQRIEVLHSQNIVKNWNAGFNFRRFNVQDFIPRSDTYYNRFSFFTDYNSTNGRYHLYAHAFWNTIKLQTNGGITNDSFFLVDKPSNLDLKGLPVRLLDAGARYRDKSFHVGNYYRLNSAKDSSSNIVELGLSNTLSNGSYAYFDETPDSSYYSQFYLGEASDDSLRFTDSRNRLSINWRPSADEGQKLTTNITLFTEHQYYRFWQRSAYSYSSLSAGANLALRYNNYSFLFNGQHLFQGDLQGNYFIEGKLIRKSSKMEISAGAQVKKTRTPVLFELQDANHFRWNNPAQVVNDQRITAGLRIPDYKIELSAYRHTTDGFYYMNQSALPTIAENAVTVTGVELCKNFRWRKWGMDNRILYQKIDNEDVLRLPEWSTFHTLYWERSLYRNTFVLRAGIEARYLSGFYGDQFMPATGFFYLQDSVTTANVILLDVFVNVKIKTASFFAKMENIGNDIITDRFYLTPYYPQAGMIFKFGVRWQFFDQ